MYWELSLCPQQIFGPLFDLEDEHIWDFVELREVGNSKKVPLSKKKLWFNFFFAKYMQRFQQPSSRGVWGLKRKCVINMFSKFGYAKKKICFGVVLDWENLDNYT